MEEVIKSTVEKISSYDIFNNFFPGLIFCYIVEKFTRFSFNDGEIWERLFIYYFVGMIISRIGSIFVEKFLKSIKIKNKKSKTKEPFLMFAPYDDYIEASEKCSFINILNETNNIYRTVIAVFISAIGVKLYDWLIYDIIVHYGTYGNNLAFIFICLLLIILFVYSYKKQTDYIKRRVEKYIGSKQKKGEN